MTRRGREWARRTTAGAAGLGLAVVSVGCQPAANPTPPIARSSPSESPSAPAPAAPAKPATATATLYTCQFDDAQISRFENGRRTPARDSSPMVLRYMDDPAGPRVTSDGGSGPIAPNRGASALSFFERSVAGTVAMTTVFPGQKTRNGMLAVLSRHITRDPYDEPLATQTFGRCQAEKVVPGINNIPD